MIVRASCPWKGSEWGIQSPREGYDASLIFSHCTFCLLDHCRLVWACESSPLSKANDPLAKPPSFDTHDLWAPAKMMVAVVKIEARPQELFTGLVFSTLQVHRTHFRRLSAWRLSSSKPGLSFDNGENYAISHSHCCVEGGSKLGQGATHCSMLC